MAPINLKQEAKVLETLKNGGLIVFPSDTVYALMADATNDQAVRKLIAFKNRAPGRPISVFATNKDFKQLVEINEKQKRVLDVLFPGPFTVILNSKHRVSKFLESEKGTLGVRVPDYEQINQLVSKFGKPITATSANISGAAPHYSIESLFKHLSARKKKLIDLVIDVGKLPRNRPSTIVDLTVPKLKILRQGDIRPSDTKTFISRLPSETKKIARLLLKKSKTDRALIFILHGELGVGKTVFVKGIGEALGIKNIVSPTFVIYYEYETGRKQLKKLIHVDLYNLTNEEELTYLKLERYLRPHNVICFEWGEKTAGLFDILRKKGRIVYVKMDYMNEKIRRIKISKLIS
jgi:L-threonylcarbamoyladenylate synthase